jgi:hypothetical protein
VEIEAAAIPLRQRDMGVGREAASFGGPTKECGAAKGWGAVAIEKRGRRRRGDEPPGGIEEGGVTGGVTLDAEPTLVNTHVVAVAEQ